MCKGILWTLDKLAHGLAWLVGICIGLIVGGLMGPGFYFFVLWLIGRV